MVRRLTFTVAREPIELEIGGEEFTAPAVLPAVVLGEILDQQAALSNFDPQAPDRLEAMLKVLATIFDLILVPESASRFRDRLYSRDNPFDLTREVLPVVYALIEEYTDRPTQLSPSSSNGSATAGTPSTDGPPPEESIPSTSPPAASAT